jgi:glucose/arabinose dehydrogenase
MKYIYFALFLICSSSAIAQDLTFELINVGPLSQPVEITNTGVAGDDRLFICQKGGQIRIIDNISSLSPSLRATPYMTLPVNNSGEGGLLGLAFSPDFQTSGKFYVNYTADVLGQFSTVISEFIANNHSDNTANPATESVLLTIPQFANNHNGGDLAFGSDGYLYIGMGDGGGSGDPQEQGQDSTTFLGSMLRIDVNSLPYSIPPDNPFITNASVPNEIWSVGWRNPWRFSFDRVTGHLFVADVGQNAMEEINIEDANDAGGRNYGWDCYEGSSPYELTGCQNMNLLTMPQYEYNHSLGSSITGGMVYRGSDYPGLYGKYIFTDFGSNVFWILTLSGTSVTQVDTLQFQGGGNLFSVAAIGDDVEGELYAAQIGGSGALYKITSTVLPVDLIDLEASVVEKGTLLHWSTASEVNSHQFVVESSQDGKTFLPIGEVPASGNSSEMNNYTYLDSSPIPGKNYYRLKILDNDATFSYSNIISVTFTPSVVFQVYPNPVNNLLNVNWSSDTVPGGFYQIKDMAGHSYLSGKLSGNSKTIDTSHLPKGAYILVITCESFHTSTSIVIIH